MMRYNEFPPEQTAELYDRLTKAGKGAVVRVKYVPTDDGAGWKPVLAVRSAAELEAKTADDDCPPDINKSHSCPPTC